MDADAILNPRHITCDENGSTSPVRFGPYRGRSTPLNGHRRLGHSCPEKAKTGLSHATTCGSPDKIRRAHSVTKDRLKTRKDRGEIQVGLRAHTKIAAGTSIDWDDRLHS